MGQLYNAYRRTGADLPCGDLLGAHGVAMEGYFWRFTRPDTGDVVIALCGVNQGGVNQGGTGDRWATLGLAGHPGGFLRTAAVPGASAAKHRLGACAGKTAGAARVGTFFGDDGRVRVDLGARSRLDVTVSGHARWPRRRFGGSSVFQCVPALNQYWHPWLLGGRAHGTAVLGGNEIDLTGAQVYAEKNWGRGGFPDSWWWGQAHGFDDPDACVAFAGGVVTAGPLRTEVTALVVALPGGPVIRLGNPVTSPVRAVVTDGTWSLHGRNRSWDVGVEAESPLRAAHVLPVPLPSERRNVPGAIEHLAGRLTVKVRRRGRAYWRGETRLAALEHGGIDRARAEVRRRGGPADATGAPPPR
ncbi:tocopherol cyclase family protein [Tomitella gaofuii]|uniref:tocopherol cyclase family protein n=1 Tax=Tomitella gaofuii TaxID=2760083 RepID=UPI0015F80B42|nr:tocopherol cyclase family protein [Tomitella gaofuii]